MKTLFEVIFGYVKCLFSFGDVILNKVLCAVGTKMANPVIVLLENIGT